MLISKKKIVFSVLLFVALFLALNEAVNFALKPYEGPSERIWSDFYGEQNVEMIYVGDSLGNRAYDPEVIDSYTGLRSFNLSSNGQSLTASYWGLERAIKTNPVKYVILSISYLNVGYHNLKSPDILNANVSYVRAMSQFDSPFSKALNLTILARECGFMKKESVNIFFPWIVNHVPLKRRTITSNIRKKLDENYAADQESIDFICRGHYEPKAVEFKSVDLDKEVKTNSKNFYKMSDPQGAALKNADKAFNKIIKLCRDNHIQLIVTFTPHPAFDSLSLGKDYWGINEELSHYFVTQGVPFYDLNMLKKDFWLNEDKYYFDFEHMNRYGSESISTAFARFFNRLQAGEDVSSLFYTREEYLASIGYIAGVLFDTYNGDNEISIHISSYQGLSVTPEYEIHVYDEQSGDLVSLRDYSADTDYSFVPMHKGSYRIRVNARQVGSGVPYERYCEKKVTF